MLSVAGTVIFGVGVEVSFGLGVGVVVVPGCVVLFGLVVGDPLFVEVGGWMRAKFACIVMFPLTDTVRVSPVAPSAQPVNL